MKFNVIIIILISIISCSTPKPRKPIARKTNTFIDESIKRNKAINKLEENFFLNKIKNDSVHTYHNKLGFWYYYDLQLKNKTIFPKKGDEVVLNYQIKNVHNVVVYSKNELGTKGQPLGDRLYKVDGEEFITGLQEGIKLMHEGEKVTFLFPSNKVFGVSGYQDKIGANQPLIIEVFLKKINTN